MIRSPFVARRAILGAPFRARPALAIVLALAVAGSTACTTQIGRSRDAFSPQIDWDGDAPDTNVERLRHYHGNEAQFYARGEGRPGVCVSFSGGGMRSASISLGVMTGLHDAGLLEEVDVASAISGGSYALSWYMVQHTDAWETQGEDYAPRATDRALFDPEGAYQKRLEENFELFAVNIGTREGLADSAGAGFVGGLQTAWHATAAISATLFSIPVNLFANGLFGWHINVVPVRALYENSIERAFHARIGDDDRLGWGLGMALTGREDPLRFDEYFDFLDAGHDHMLFPVIAANANFDVNTDASATDRSNRLYEFTPLRHGADAIGFTNEFGDLTVGRAVAISGSAWDSNALLTGSGALFASALNTDLGYYIENPLVRGDAAIHPMAWWEQAYWVAPVPLYLGFSRWQKDPRGVSLQITDGGHTENLGVFPLARRLCEEIVVVDATGDRHLSFVDYRITRQALLSEFDMELEVPAIDRWIEVLDAIDELAAEEQRMATARRWGGPGASIEAADYGRANRVRRSLMVLDATLLEPFRGCVPDDPDIPRWWEDRDVLLETVDCQLLRLRGEHGRLDPRKARNWVRPEIVFDGRAPVVGGRIGVDRGGPAITPVASGTARSEIPVTWIKLSLFGPSCGERARANQVGVTDAPVYSDVTCEYRAHQLEWVGSEFRSSRSPFPHESTGDIAYSRKQYRAARNLGRSLVEWGVTNRPVGTIFANDGEAR